MPKQKHIAPTACATDTFPVELFLELFTILVDEDPSYVIVLSHVCRRWREIVIFTPALWRTLILSDIDPHEKLKLWKERSDSKISSLTLRSTIDCSKWMDIIRDLERLLQWNHLETLHVEGKISAPLFLMLLEKDSLPELKQILLDCYGEVMSGPHLGLAPNELHILNYTKLTNNYFCHTQLRILHCRCVIECGPVPVGIMRDALLLEDFVLEFGYSKEIRWDLDDPLPEFMHLRSIELRNVRNAFSLLNLISAPSLQHLTISGATSMIDESLHHVENCAVTADALVRLLPHVPCLEKLHINGIDEVVNPVLWSLAGGPPDGELASGMRISLLCPYLKDVDASHCFDLQTSSVLALVTKRLQGGEKDDRCCRIDSLRMDGCPNVDVEQLSWFTSNVRQFSCDALQVV